MSVVQILSLFQLVAFLCRLLETCERVSVCGEQVVSCLNQQMRQYHQASEAAQEVSGKMGHHVSKYVLVCVCNTNC